MIIDAIPGDKSISHRAIIISSLISGTSKFEGFLTSDDCMATLSIFKALGVEIEQDGPSVRINSQGIEQLKVPQNILNVGNSGTGIRLISGVLAALPFESTITGDASIQKRPMARIMDPLRQMGATFLGDNQTPPLTIRGNKHLLDNWHYSMPVASAQVKSAILLAALTADVSVTVVEPEPCRDHTERMLRLFGAQIDINNGTIKLKRSVLNSPLEPIQIPADISSALFFICYSLMIGKQTTFLNIGLNPSRIGCLTILKMMGANISISEHPNAYEPMGTIIVNPSPNLKNIDVPLELIPNIIDELPILAILATSASGTFKVRGAKELRVKESDRIAGVCRLINALGGHIKEYEDGFDVIATTLPLNQEFTFNAHFDHRLAMSAHIAAAIYKSHPTIEGEASIATSFPNFMEILGQFNK